MRNEKAVTSAQAVPEQRGRWCKGGLKKPSLTNGTILLVQVRVDLVRNFFEQRWPVFMCF